MGEIYSIENTKNNKKYIGQTSFFKRRVNYHRAKLRKGAHKNPHLQKSWDKYGQDSFEFKILANDIPKKYLDDVERGLIATLQTMNPKYGFNKQSGGSFGKRYHESSKLKMSASRRKRDPSLNKGPKPGTPSYNSTKVIGPDGEIYLSMRAAERKYGLPKNILAGYIRKNITYQGLVFVKVTNE